MSIVRSIMTMFQFRVEGGKLASVDKQIGGVAMRAKAADRAFNSMSRNLNTMYRIGQVAITAMMGSRFFNWLIKGYADTADEAAKQSKAIGITIEQYQELSYTSKLAGSDVGTVATGLQRLARAADDALRGSKTAKKAFKQIGIDPGDKELLRDQYQLYLRIADAYASGAYETIKVANSQILLGKSGARLIPLLNEGSAGIRKYAAEARKLGLVISAKAAKEAEFYNDQMLRLKSAFVGIRNVIARRLLPWLNKNITALVNWFKQGDNVRRVVTWLTRGLKLAGAVLAMWLTNKTISMVKKFRGAVLEAVRWVRNLGLAGVFASLKLGLLLAGIAAIVLLVEDLYFFATGGKSVIGELLGNSEDADALRAVLLEFGEAWSKLWGTLKPVLVDLWKALKPLLSKIWELVKPLIPFLGKVLVGVISLITVAVTHLANFIRGTIELVQDLWRRAGDIITGIVDGIRDAWNGIVEKVRWVIKAVKNDLRDAWDSLPGPVKKAARAIKSIFEKVFSWIKSTVGAIFGGIRDFLIEIGVLKEKTSTIGQAAMGGFTKLMSAEQKRDMTQFRPVLMPTTTALPMRRYEPMPAGLRTGGRQVAIDRRAHVGAVHVHVTGSLNMDAPETLEKIQSGAHDAMLNAFHDLYSDTKEPA
jgi:hypothetical protein